MITVINKLTGEIVELADERLADLVTNWQIAKQYEQMAADIKKQIKHQLPNYLDPKDETDIIGQLQFKRLIVQRQTYDKAAVRQVLQDLDLVDEFLIVDKAKMDEYIKENLATLGDLSSELRATMVNTGKPYEVYRLDRVTV